jgi:hypothetical protein
VDSSLYRRCENNLDSLLVLIKVGSDTSDFDKKSPVFITAQKNHHDVMKTIMDVGGDMDANKKKESFRFHINPGK